VVAHPANDVDVVVAPALRQLSTRMGATRALPRSQPEVMRFFDGLEMVEPGLVQLHRWRAGAAVDTGKNLAAYGGVGRKP
jgi:S-adenosyl methyltransferase